MKRIALFASLLAVAALLLRLPPVTSLDEPWRILHISEGRLPTKPISVGGLEVRLPTPAPHGFILLFHLLWRAGGGDFETFLLLFRLVSFLLAAFFLTLLWDTAERLGATPRSLALYLPALLLPSFWLEYLYVKEYLLGALLLLVYGRIRLGFARAGPGLEALLLLGTVWISPAAGSAACWMACVEWIQARENRRGIFLSLLPALALLLIERTAATVFLAPPEGFPAAGAREFRTALARIPIEIFWYSGLLSLLDSVPRIARLALLGLAAGVVGEILRGLAAPHGRRLLLWGLGWILLYPFLHITTYGFQLRYFLFFTWFWIPLRLASVPVSRPFVRPLGWGAVLFFLLLATNWAPTLLNAPATPSYTQNARAARTAAGGKPLVFVDQMHRLAGRVVGVRSPWVLPDTGWSANWVIDPRWREDAYLTGDEKVLSRENFPGGIPFARVWFLTAANPEQRSILERKCPGLGGTREETQAVGREAVIERWRFGPLSPPPDRIPGAPPRGR